MSRHTLAIIIASSIVGGVGGAAIATYLHRHDAGQAYQGGRKQGVEDAHRAVQYIGEDGHWHNCELKGDTHYCPNSAPLNSYDIYQQSSDGGCGTNIAAVQGSVNVNCDQPEPRKLKPINGHGVTVTMKPDDSNCVERGDDIEVAIDEAVKHSDHPVVTLCAPRKANP